MLSEKVVLKIEKSAQGGDGFTHLKDGRACFVQGALPLETVRVEITNNAKDYAKAKVVEVLESHPERVIPKCPFYARCGGCSLQHATPKLQELMGKESLKDTFRRLAHIELPENFTIYSGKPWEYRNRVRVLKQGNQWGFREGSSHKVAPFAQKCPILVKELREFLNSSESKKIQSKEVNFFENGKGKVSFYYKGMSPVDFSKYAETSVEIENKKISTDASVFFQSNLDLLPRLVNRIKEEVKPGDLLIDLFSGVGFFASILEDSFEKVVAVERDKNCLRHGKKNLSSKAEFVASPAEDWLKEHIVQKDASLIVDPPRTGLPKTALDAIAESSVSRLVYVSCNPVTLARDISLLTKFGFTMTSIEGFAFYPQTPHLEMLSVLER